jgi:transcriptional regulator with XRE-family HTH domain
MVSDNFQFMTQSHEVLKTAITQCGAKAVAADMGLSRSMIYKWCQSSDGPDCSGTGNPLDRLLEICRLTGDDSMIDWLCQQTNSFRVKNPPIDPTVDIGQSVMSNTQAILKEFTEVLKAVTESYDHELRIDLDESKRIRAEWDKLKSVAEQFVCACEQGAFDHNS